MFSDAAAVTSLFPEKESVQVRQHLSLDAELTPRVKIASSSRCAVMNQWMWFILISLKDNVSGLRKSAGYILDVWRRRCLNVTHNNNNVRLDKTE
jgi:hypothetical protein